MVDLAKGRLVSRLAYGISTTGNRSLLLLALAAAVRISNYIYSDDGATPRAGERRSAKWSVCFVWVDKPKKKQTKNNDQSARIIPSSQFHRTQVVRNDEEWICTRAKKASRMVPKCSFFYSAAATA